MKRSESIIGADLGSSSSYSNKIHVEYRRYNSNSIFDGKALKIVVEKVSL